MPNRTLNALLLTALLAVAAPGRANEIVVAEGYALDVFAQRLGEITDLARHPDGTIYVADRAAGRIFRIQDREMDGRADITQALTPRFDSPTGLAMIGETLFVADRGGLWRMDPSGGTPSLVAPFARSGTLGEPHPIVALPDGRIRLGQSLPGGSTRLLDIDPATGRADLVESGRGSIIGFTRAAPDPDTPLPVWPIVRREDGIWFGATLAGARKMALSANAVWIDRQTHALFIASETGLSRAPAQLGGIGRIDLELMGGFEGASTNSRMGQAGPIVADERGLFVADLEGGRLWRLYPVEVEPEDIPVTAETEPEPDTAASPSPEDRLLRGSGMGPASTIDASPTPIRPAPAQSGASEDE